MSRKLLLILFSLAIIGLILFLPAVETQAQAGTASQMIAAINQLRANNGLAALEQHPILMSVTQAQSEYLAARGQGGHDGPGGSTPKDRAIAAGFGGGATIYLSENWAAGNNLSIQRAIYDLWDDPAHMGTMLGTQYKYIGAGVAFDGNYVYYTVNTGAWVGDPNPNPAPPTSGEESPILPTTTAIPVEKSTPNPDGSIVHVVQAGQTLWTIAVVYEIPLEELRAVNGFTDNTVIYVGNEVIIHPADTFTLVPTSPPTNTSTASPSPTEEATATESPTPSSQKMPSTPVLSPSPTPVEFSSDGSKRPAFIAAVLIAGGAVLVTLIRSLSRK